MLDRLKPAPNPYKIQFEGTTQCLFVHALPIKKRADQKNSKTSTKAMIVGKRIGKDTQMGINFSFKGKQEIEES